MHTNTTRSVPADSKAEVIQPLQRLPLLEGLEESAPPVDEVVGLCFYLKKRGVGQCVIIHVYIHTHTPHMYTTYGPPPFSSSIHTHNNLSYIHTQATYMRRVINIHVQLPQHARRPGRHRRAQRGAHGVGVQKGVAEAEGVEGGEQGGVGQGKGVGQAVVGSCGLLVFVLVRGCWWGYI